VERNNNILEEDDVLLAQGHRETRDDTCLDVEQLGSSVEFVCLVDQEVEALIDCLTDHLASWHQLSIQLVQNILEIVAFDRLFRVEQI